MDADEREIFQFLKTWGTGFTSAKEIARRATVKKRFYDNPGWAQPVLLRMVERGILERDIQGRFRIKPISRKDRTKRWVAPDITKILEESGVEVEGADELESDDYYEQL
jgi:hypothetical protein